MLCTHEVVSSIVAILFFFLVYENMFFERLIIGYFIKLCIIEARMLTERERDVSMDPLQKKALLSTLILPRYSQPWSFFYMKS